MMASVSGRRMMKREPTPSSVLTSTVPRSASMLRSHHVHADAAAGQVGDLLGGGEAGLEDQVDDFLFGERLARLDQAALDGLGLDPVPVEAAAVVDHLDDDAARIVVGVELDPALGRLAGGGAHRGRLDAVVHGVAHQVHQRVADLLDHRLVELGLGAADDQFDVLAQFLARRRAPRGGSG